MKLLAIFLLVVAPTSAFGQKNPKYTLRIQGPCDETIVGLPGSVYDDHTGGAPYFTGTDSSTGRSDRIPRMRAGNTWEIVLTTEENIVEDWGVYAWQFAVGVEEPLRIVDITLDGTAGCDRGDFPECLAGVGFQFAALTGPPMGGGPQTEENVGAVSAVLLKMDGVFTLPPRGSKVVCRIRVSGDFPDDEGEEARAKVYFAARQFDTKEYSPGVAGPERFGPNIGQGGLITIDEGDPPLRVEDCLVTLKASMVAAFIRCDANQDLDVNLSDPVWILNELFLGGAATRCRPAADCDGDGEHSVSDAIYALSHLFLGGPVPPEPYPRCDRVDVPVEDCPPGSTGCP